MDFKEVPGISEMEELAIAFRDYTVIQVKEAPFRKPNKEESVFAASTKTNTLWIIGLTSVVFLLLTVCLIAVFIMEAVKKPQVLTAKVAHKYFRYNGGSQKNGKSYYIVAIVDEKKKLLLSNISVSLKEYDQLSNDDSVLVVNHGIGVLTAKAMK